MNFLKSFFNKKNGLNEIIKNIDPEDWNDIELKIVEKNKLENGFWRLLCKAKYSNKIVGIRVYILDKMKEGIINGEIDNSKFYKETIIFESTGVESDNLLNCLNELYLNNNSPKKFKSEHTYTTVFPLNTEIAILENGYYKFKIFLDSENTKNLYSKLYVNVNLSENIIELKEKDEDYRENIIKNLTE